MHPEDTATRRCYTHTPHHISGVTHMTYLSCGVLGLQVCIEKLQDLQLALVISRLYESDFETSSTYKRILQRHVLGQDPQIPPHSDPFLRSMACWVLDRYSRALDTLLEPPTLEEERTDFNECITPPGTILLVLREIV